jgi:hypothetical protein
MLPLIVKLLVTAVDGEPGVNATVWSVDEPVQAAFVYRWKMTFPVGFGTLADVPAALVTETLSWTTRPAPPLVTTWPLELRMSVVTASSAHSFVAGPVPPGPAVVAVAGSVSRVTDTLFVRPVIENVVDAFAVVVPAVGPLMMIVH